MANKTPITFKIINKDKFVSEEGKWFPSYKPGQLIFVEDIKGNESKLWLDFHGYRLCYTNSKTMNSGLNYVGISSTDPIEKVTIQGKDDYTPQENDLVVYGYSEYLYRKGEDGEFKWYPLGNEMSDTWLDESEINAD